MKTLAQLAALFRFLQLFTHAAHNLASGCTFFADHAFLGELYGEYEGIYDSLIERMIGLGMNPSITEITAAANQMITAAGEISDQDDSAFIQIMNSENKARALVEMAFADRSFSQGTLNLLAGIADDSEIRSYKIGRRLL
jgi:DNA-binding ferritin-like protein